MYASSAPSALSGWSPYGAKQQGEILLFSTDTELDPWTIYRIVIR